MWRACGLINFSTFSLSHNNVKIKRDFSTTFLWRASVWGGDIFRVFLNHYINYWVFMTNCTIFRSLDHFHKLLSVYDQLCCMCMCIMLCYGMIWYGIWFSLKSISFIISNHELLLLLISLKKKMLIWVQQLQRKNIAR